MKLKCENCRWWDMGASQSFGQCRFNAPTMDEAGFGVWPQTGSVAWCGKFEARDDRAARLLGTKYLAGSDGANP